MRNHVILGAAALLLFLGCAERERTTPAAEKREAAMKTGTFVLRSSAFENGAPLPKRHAYKGEGLNRSPALAWEGVPEGTREFALVCDDPDAPVAEPWVHWVLYGIPAAARALPEGVPARETLEEPQGARQGRNSFGEIGWGGPYPPPGHGTHHYHFKLYALDRELDLGPGATKKQLLQAMEGRILATAELVGTYRR